jgi:hypothetical protein
MELTFRAVIPLTEIPAPIKAAINACVELVGIPYRHAALAQIITESCTDPNVISASLPVPIVTIFAMVIATAEPRRNTPIVLKNTPIMSATLGFKHSGRDHGC